MFYIGSVALNFQNPLSLSQNFNISIDRSFLPEKMFPKILLDNTLYKGVNRVIALG